METHLVATLGRARIKISTELPELTAQAIRHLKADVRAGHGRADLFVGGPETRIPAFVMRSDVLPDGIAAIGQAASGQLWIVLSELGSASSRSLMRLLRGLLIREAMACGYELMHAACVCNGDTGVLIAGPKHAGKTTLAIELMRTGFGLVANDKVLLEHRDGAVLAIGATTAVGIRAGTLSLLPEDAGVLRAHGTQSVDGRLYVDPDELATSLRSYSASSVVLRFGVVLGSEGGAEPTVLTPRGRDVLLATERYETASQVCRALEFLEDGPGQRAGVKPWVSALFPEDFVFITVPRQPLPTMVQTLASLAS